MMLGLNLIILLMAGAAAEDCLTSHQIAKATHVHSKSTTEVHPGERLKIVSSSKNTSSKIPSSFRVLIGDGEYAVKIKKFSRSTASSCGPQMCARLKSAKTYYKSPNPYDKADPLADGVYPVVSKSQNWFRVQANNETFVWLSGSQLKGSRVRCDETISESAAIDSQAPDEDLNYDLSHYRWRFGFEGGYISQVSSKPLRDLLTAIPAGGTNVNNDSFDSPFIEQINDGVGWYAGATLETAAFWDLRLRWALGYKVRMLETEIRPNPLVPGNAVVTYDQLGRETETDTLSFVYLSTTLKHQGFKFFYLNWQPGVHLGVDFALENYSYEFASRPNKLTVYTVGSGYNSLEFFYGPRLDVTLSFFVFSMMANFNSYQMEPTFSVGVQF